jgi:hypothetical protein
MHPLVWLSYAAFGATSLAMLATVNSLHALMQDAKAGRRTRRLKLRRMGVVVGLWQISTGLCIVAMDPSNAWTGGIALFGMGGMFLAGAWVSRKTDIPPWWAPEP